MVASGKSGLVTKYFAIDCDEMQWSRFPRIQLCNFMHMAFFKKYVVFLADSAICSVSLDDWH
jgi:hypothetical protein